MQDNDAQKKLDLMFTLLIDHEINASNEPVRYCMFENMMSGGNPGNCLRCRFLFGSYCLLHLLNDKECDINDVIDGIKETVKNNKIPDRFTSRHGITVERQSIENAVRILKHLPEYQYPSINKGNVQENRFSNIDLV